MANRSAIEYHGIQGNLALLVWIATPAYSAIAVLNVRTLSYNLTSICSSQ